MSNMRLWTIHPRYLDAKGLTALWREALLARKVLQGQTAGYRHHPQLERFRMQPRPIACLNRYLRVVHEESVRRGYRFDQSKLGRTGPVGTIDATTGQLATEWRHLRAKLEVRRPAMLSDHVTIRQPEPHPLFHVVPGPAADWERAGR